MKIFKSYIYIACLFTLGWTSCSNDEEILPDSDKPEDVAVLEWMSQANTFESEPSQQEIQLKASANWTIQTDQSWCMVSPSSGKPGIRTVTIKVEANKDNDERNSAVILQMNHKEQRMTIRQKQQDALLVSSSKAEVPAKGDAIEVEVKANVDYECEIDEKSKEWIKESTSRGLESHKHQFAVAENKTTQPREGKIIFRSKDAYEIVTVYQQAGEEPQLVLTQKEYIIDYQPKTLHIEIQSNTAYQLILPDIDWIKEDQSRTLSSYTHYIQVDENTTYGQREAIILVVHGKETEKISIIQQQKDAIILAKNRYELAAEAQTLEFDIASNVAYTVATSSDWIQQLPQSKALTVSSLKFGILANTEQVERSGEITIIGEKAQQKIAIVQAGKSDHQLTLEKEPNVFDSEGTIQYITLHAPTDWTATSAEPWCKVTPSKGKAGTHTLAITTDENTTYDERNTRVIFKAGTAEKIITVTQKQKDALLVSSSKDEIKAEGGTVSIEVKSNVPHQITIDPATAKWVSRIHSRALNTHTYLFKVAPNTMFESREGTIEIEGNGKVEVVSIFQDARQRAELVLTTKHYYLDKGQQSMTVELKSSSSVNMLQPSVDWIHEDQSRSLSTYTKHLMVKENTSGKERTAEIHFVADGQDETIHIYQSDIPFNKQCRVRIITHGKTLQLPLLTGSETVDGTVVWNGGQATYQPDFTHVFQPNEKNPFDNSCEMRINHMENLYLDDLQQIYQIEIED